MCMNEVLASRANELIGETRNSQSPISAIDHVNMSQSTNDVYPTAVRVATILRMEELLCALRDLEEALATKAREFADIL